MLAALVHLVVKLVVFREMCFERVHDEDVVFSLQCWCPLYWDDDFCPHTVKEYLKKLIDVLVVHFW